MQTLFITLKKDLFLKKSLYFDLRTENTSCLACHRIIPDDSANPVTNVQTLSAKKLSCFLGNIFATLSYVNVL
jgi:hypothetical protein